MALAKTHLKRIRTELQELLGMISVSELVVNQKLARNYEIVHQQMLRWA